MLRKGARTGSRGRGVFCSLLALAALATPGSSAESAPETLALDVARSHVRLELERSGLMKFLGHDHHIEAPLAEGRIEIAESDPVRSSVYLRFEAGRLFLIPGSEPAGDIPTVEERMRGPEVLEVAKYPEIAFASTAVKSQPAGPALFKLIVMGALTLKGRSVPVEIPLEVRRAGGELEAKGEAFLSLRELGIEPPSVAGVVKVANRFRLVFEIHARP